MKISSLTNQGERVDYGPGTGWWLDGKGGESVNRLAVNMLKREAGRGKGKF